ncbi:MAG: MFS transporter, partial [Sphingomonadaceae bacterium]|nr:MFS transporter [Sphingomonadaceae bacterium]
FAQLFVARLGVGIGEAGGVAPSYALIADSFAPRVRARALAIYSLGIPLGSAVGVLFGGLVAARVDWRMAFVTVGVVGALAAPLFKIIVRDPPKATAPDTGIAGVFGLLAAKPSFWLLSFGAASSSMLGYGLAFWLPLLLQRSFGLGLIATSHFYGAVLLIGGVSGIVAGGVLADRLGTRGRGAQAWVPALSFVAAVPLFAAAALSHSVSLAFVLLLVPQALAYVWLAPVISAVQHLVPSAMRASASACFLLINNLIGLGGGTFFLGRLSDWLTPFYGVEALRYSIVAGLGFYLIAALLMASAVRPLRREWVD